ncbi:50S ribosomal protein L7/L12-like protein (plasmid) [Crocosphaera subtropica ATCC 51142]|uniref:50S ribosomal protein L7/L12-like protein n=1 Tax=Crocosphaera subtropica (strain ATCC 51142 / BH68) TaxID=43989 RepID=B1X3C1_CROS5|nr:ribosomal protein L7/L12 [Crocosphaera subtropica]ACB54632.1 50S ribosomal protein L7/L12-like protein [Crocosphaera subtropica ATCC 51142]
MTKKLEKLLEQREKINARIQKARARETAQKRKEDTRRKILLGALVIEMMDKGELDDGVIMKRLEGFLTRDIDRKLFDFPVQGDSDSTETTSDKKPTSSKKTTESKGAKKGSSASQSSEGKIADLIRTEVEGSSVEIILEEYPSDQKMAILRTVREVTNLGLKEAKDLIESTPCVIHKTTQSSADGAKKKLEKFGAKVSLKVDS